MSRPISRSGFIGGLCALTTTALVAPRAGSAQGLRKVAIGTSSSSIPGSTSRIVREIGLYEKHGLAATVTPMDTGSVATAGLLGGSFDFVSSGPSDVILAQGRGQDVKALISTYRGFAATVVISQAAAQKTGVPPDAPSASRLKALNGLTIASTSAQSTYTVALKASTDAAGAKVNVVYMDQPAMVAAFQRGVIDGFTSSAPYVLQPVLAGTGVVWISGPKGDFPAASSPSNSTVLMVRGAFAKANPDLMKQMAEVFAEFWAMMDQRPDEVKAAVRRLWPSLDATSIDLVFATDALGFKAAPLTVDQMRHDIDFMKLGGLRMPQGETLDPAAMLVF